MALTMLSSAMIVGAQLAPTSPKEVLKKDIVGPNGKKGGYIVIIIWPPSGTSASSATFTGVCKDPLIKPNLPYCLQLSTNNAGQSQANTKGISQSQAAKNTVGNLYSLQCTATKDPGVIYFGGAIQNNDALSLLTSKPNAVIFKVI